MSFTKAYSNLETQKESAKYDSNQNLIYEASLALRVQRENQPTWNLIEDYESVKIYVRQNTRVVVCYNDLGGKVDFLSALINTDGVNFGNKGGDQPTIFRKTIRTFLTDYKSQQNTGRLVFNSAFFSNNSLTTPNPTQIAIAYKDSTAQHDGYERNPNITTRKFFEVKNFGFDCRNYVDPTAAQVDNGYTIAGTYGNNNIGYVVGLSTADDSKFPELAIGRTIIGCRDDDGDGINETFVALICNALTQDAAVNEIKSFGVLDRNICIVDGGGSSQIVSNRNQYLNTNRTLPTAIGIRN